MGILFRLLSHLPLHLLHNLGALAGWLAYGLSPTYQRHLRENIALAGAEDTLGEAVAEAGKTILELPRLWLRPHGETAIHVVRVTGWQLAEEARAAGRGVLFLTPHLGCFEISAQYIADFMPITVLYRRPRQDWLAPLMEAGRGATLKLAPADLSGVRRLMKALKAGEAAGMLPDQVPGNGEGTWAPFFGRPAYTMTLASRLAQTGAAVLLVFAERLHYGAGYHLQFFAPEGDVSTPEGINREIERIVRMRPGQYLWGYNRYKTPAGAPDPT